MHLFQGREQVTRPIFTAMHTQDKEQVPIAQEEETHQEEDTPAAMQAVAVRFWVRHLQVRS